MPEGGTGQGKTTIARQTWHEIQREKPDASMVIVTRNTHAVVKLAQDFGAFCYLEAQDNPHLLRQHRLVAITPNSLPKLCRSGGSLHIPDFLFVDESQAVNGCFADETFNGEQATRAFRL